MLRHTSLVMPTAFVFLLSTHMLLAAPPEELGAPIYPKPPSQSDCRSYQTAMEEFERVAQDELRRCVSEGRSCPTIVGRNSYARGRVGYVAACFASVRQGSNTQDSIEFLTSQKDADVKAFGSAAKRLRDTQQDLEFLGEIGKQLREKREEAVSLFDLRSRISNFANLSDSEKLDAHKEIVSRLNAVGNFHDLSKQLTENSLEHVTEKHREALARLDIQLKAISDQHQKLVSRAAVFANISRRKALQEARSADADAVNYGEREALRIEREERDATNASIERENRARREAEYRARMQAIAVAEQDSIQRQIDAQQMMSAFTAIMGAAIASSSRNNFSAPYGYNGSGAPIQRPSPPAASGVGGSNCVDGQYARCAVR